MPNQARSDRARLLELLHQQGILYESENQPIVSPNGISGRWMLDTLNVTLTSEGSALAGRCLLQLLEKFEGTQLATYGTIGMPLLTSCMLQSQGKYTGLIVRKEVKDYGSRRRIEGPIDLSQPVIMIDDSISSGRAMLECLQHLREAGLWVIGGIALVRFEWDRGFGRLIQEGLQMASVFEIFDDFVYQMPDEPDQIINPTQVFDGLHWHNQKAPEGLHPTQLARAVMETYLREGRVLLPPQQLDQAHDATGGVYVSVRDREDIYERYARDGFWRFPDQAREHNTAKDIVLASFKTAQKLAPAESGLAQLQQSALAVTFFSALEVCDVGELDNDRYGIVVRSTVRPRMGGALPRMPGIANEWEQFQHARIKNAQLISFEPFEILRHDVTKIIEPGIEWQESGAPRTDAVSWYEQSDGAGALASYAFAMLQAITKQQRPPIPPTLTPPQDLDLVFLSLYREGALCGCVGTALDNLEHSMFSLVQAVMQDQRFPALPASGPSLSVIVHCLYQGIDTGPWPPAYADTPVSHGHHALMVSQGQRTGLLLPTVAITNDLSPQQFIAEVIDKAGITRPPYQWRRFDCTSWFVDGPTPQRLEGGFPVPASPVASSVEQLEHLIELMAVYMLRHQREDGTLFTHYAPCQDTLQHTIHLPYLAHAYWLLQRAATRLDEADLATAARLLQDYLTPLLTQDEGQRWWLKHPESALRPSVSEISLLVMALCEGQTTAPPSLRPLVDTLWDSIGQHGMIQTHETREPDDDAYQDYLPGQVLLALATACQLAPSWLQPERCMRALRFYRHRFRVKRHFGQVSWLMQAFTAWWKVTQDPIHAAFVFEIGDWVLAYQSDKSGGFINDHQPNTPGFSTALYLEGLGTALHLARESGDAERAESYLEACQRGFQFLDRLVYQPRDAALLPNPDWAMGGVRPSQVETHIRIDFVQHTLFAALELYAAMSP